MSTEARLAAIEQEDRERFENLRQDRDELCREADPSVPAPDLPDELLVRMVEAGSAYATLPRKFLASCGLVLRSPEDLPGDDVKSELWRAVWAMALLRLLLDHTDHLGDRQLYQQLWDEVLAEPTTFKPGEPEVPIFVCDLLSGHSQEHYRLLATYYDDRLEDEERRRALAGLEGEPPSPRPRPFDRDRFLP